MNYMQTSQPMTDPSVETLYRLSGISATEKDWKLLLDELLTFSRKVFIVDNLAIYLSDINSQRLEVVYAKSFGRGKSSEADVSWGESMASRVVSEKKVLVEEPQNHSVDERLTNPYILGIPLQPYEIVPGALVMIRFGGPDFDEKAIRYAEFLGSQVNFILGKKVLSEFARKVEIQSSVTQLQENFINTISHELRNPLGFIKGYTTTLLREDTKWDVTTQTDFLKIIDRETNHLQELIDNLLDSSRLQSGQMKFDTQLIRLDALIRDEVSRAQINCPELVVHMDFDPSIQPIKGDPNRLAQVFDNLLNNSIKYAPGAEIAITIRQTKTDMMIDYRDSGPGVSEKCLPQIFTRFFREPEQSINVHGSGLGLSICKEIIERHSGEMTVSVPPGWGLAFTIRLPITPWVSEQSNGDK
jgi:two-component system sensor histidine kinase KdpD